MIDTALFRQKEWLTQKYCDEELTQCEMAEKAGCTQGMIAAWMKRLDVPRRKAGPPKIRLSESIPLRSQKSWLYHKYWDEELGTGEMAKIAGCGEDRVRRWMKEYGIRRRTKTEVQILRNSKYDDRLYRQKEWLRQKYWDEEMAPREMAKIAGCTIKMIKDQMKRLGVPRRTRLDAQRMSCRTPEYRAKRSAATSKQLKRQWADPVYRESMSGENAYRWDEDACRQGYPLEFNAYFKASVRNADGNQCVVCDTIKRLCVHHIDRNKANTTMDNCITLCGSCHARIHASNKKIRKKWRRYFEEYVEGDE